MWYNLYDFILFVTSFSPIDDGSTVVEEPVVGSAVASGIALQMLIGMYILL